MLNSAKLETAYTCLYQNTLMKSSVLNHESQSVILLVNVKMLTNIGILTLMIRINFMLSMKKWFVNLSPGKYKSSLGSRHVNASLLVCIDVVQIIWTSLNSECLYTRCDFHFHFHAVTITMFSFEPLHEKTCLWGFWPGTTQTRLYSDRIWIQAWNFGFRK